MTNEEIKALSTDDLNTLLGQIRLELKSRLPADDFVLYTHSCMGATSSHLSKHRHWAKLVSDVDISKSNGYAFSGVFLSTSSENKIPSGSIVVETCGTDISGYVVDSSGKQLITTAKTYAMSDFINQIAHLLNDR